MTKNPIREILEKYETHTINPNPKLWLMDKENDLVLAEAQLQQYIDDVVESVIETNKDYIYLKKENPIEQYDYIKKVDEICDIREELRNEQRARYAKIREGKVDEKN